MANNIIEREFNAVNLEDTFFDSLRDNYQGFNEWFKRKAHNKESAYILLDDNGSIQAFLYVKIENGSVDDVEPQLPKAKRLKIGTFKVNPHSTRLGERFLKLIFDDARKNGVQEIYVTIYPDKHELINFLKIYGFVKMGNKKEEFVFVKNMRLTTGNLLFDYPRINISNSNFFSLSIYPVYHTKLFPDSMLKTEQKNVNSLIRDISYTNSIHKIYISYMRGLSILKNGDVLVIRRSAEKGKLALYNSVFTTVCLIEEVRTKHMFKSIDEYLGYVKSYSVFDQTTLINLWNKNNMTVIKMTYNYSLAHRITNKEFLESIGIEPLYWGFFRLTKALFKEIIMRGGVDERFIVDKA